MLDPQINKSEFILSLMIINLFMLSFNNRRTVIKVRADHIHNNDLNTSTINKHLKQLILNLVGRKLICINEKSPTVVLFEKIERTNDHYEIEINSMVRKIIKSENDFTIIEIQQINQLKKYQMIRFYCLIKMWANNKYYICYIQWLKWYLNTQDIETKNLLNLYITDYLEKLKQLKIIVKMTKHKKETDKREITKLIFDIFDTNTYEVNNEGI